jgi:hypothetical protein
MDRHGWDPVVTDSPTDAIRVAGNAGGVAPRREIRRRAEAGAGARATTHAVDLREQLATGS